MLSDHVHTIRQFPLVEMTDRGDDEVVLLVASFAVQNILCLHSPLRLSIAPETAQDLRVKSGL